MVHNHYESQDMNSVDVFPGASERRAQENAAVERSKSLIFIH